MVMIRLAILPPLTNLLSGKNVLGFGDDGTGTFSDWCHGHLHAHIKKQHSHD